MYVCILIFSIDTRHLELGPTHVISFNLNYLFKGLSSNAITFRGTGVKGFAMSFFFGGGQRVEAHFTQIEGIQ